MMQTTYNWIHDYCPLKMPPEDLAHKLSEVGLAVETVETLPDGDSLLELEVTSNRGDCLSVLGIAREVAAITGDKVVYPRTVENQPLASGRGPVDVMVEDASACPRYTAQLIRNVRTGPSPAWLVNRLQAVGVRSINNIVDVTNFVLMEYGQPLHAFDHDLLKGGCIIVRRARDGEIFEAIDHSKRALSHEDLIICDAERPVALAGVMGGVNSEVREHTVNILLESAAFDPAMIRLTSKRHKLASPSSYRFERGTDFDGVVQASLRAARLILDVAGGDLVEGMVDVAVAAPPPVRVHLRPARVKRLLGIDVPKARVREILESLGFHVDNQSDDGLSVTIPPFRKDIAREVDLIEEIIRIHGYDHIPGDQPLPVRVVRPSLREKMQRRISDLLSAWGYHEAVTDPCLPDEDWTEAGPWTDARGVQLQNPVRHGHGLLRKSLIHPLLRTRKLNQDHGRPHTDLFELGTIFLPRADGVMPDEHPCVGFCGGELPRVKGIASALCDAIGVKTDIVPAARDVPIFEPGMALDVCVAEQRIGLVAAVSTQLLGRLKLRGPVSVAELNLDGLRPHARLRGQFREIPRFPEVEREFSFIVPEPVRWLDIRQCIRRIRHPLIADVRFYDLFRDASLGGGNKAVHMCVMMSASDRTLTAEEIDHASDQVVQSMAETFGARLR